MSSYIMRRLLQVIPTIVISSILLFSLLNLMRGDAIDIYFGVSADRTPQAVAETGSLGILDASPRSCRPYSHQGRDMEPGEKRRRLQLAR